MDDAIGSGEKGQRAEKMIVIKLICKACRCRDICRETTRSGCRKGEAESVMMTD